MKTLNTSDISYLISSRTNYNEEVVKRVLNSFVGIIKEFTEDGEYDVSMWRFGRFYSTEYKNKRKLYFECGFNYSKKVEKVDDQINAVRHIKW